MSWWTKAILHSVLWTAALGLLVFIASLVIENFYPHLAEEIAFRIGQGLFIVWPVGIYVVWSRCSLERSKSESRRRRRRRSAESRHPEESLEAEEMPASVRKALEEVAAEVETLNGDHEAAVTEQKFEQAADLRARAEGLRKRKAAILREWRQSQKPSDMSKMPRAEK